MTPDLRFYLGRAYHLVLEFDKAKEHYLAARELYTANGMVDKVMMVDKYIGECENGKEIVSHPIRVIITNLGDSVNSAWMITCRFLPITIQPCISLPGDRMKNMISGIRMIISFLKIFTAAG